MNLRLFVGALCALMSMSGVARADTIISQWNFNSLVPDGSSSTGSILPSLGAGSASAIGGVSTSFAAGSPRDLAASDNTAWSLGSWPSQGTGSGTAGVQFLTSTLGVLQPIQISFDLRFTATASSTYQLQATTDGLNFSNVSGGVATFGALGNNSGTAFTSGGLFSTTVAASNQAFVQAISYQFAPGSAYENNAQFGVRIVSVFDGASYDAAGSASNYSAAGNVRVDMVTVSAASTAAVPEPATTATLMGLGVLTVVIAHRGWRRRRSAYAVTPTSPE